MAFKSALLSGARIRRLFQYRSLREEALPTLATMIQVAKQNGLPFEQMLRLVEPLYGGSALVRSQRVSSLSIEYRKLVERLVNVVCPLKEAHRYWFRALYLVFSMAELANRPISDEYSQYRIVKLCDFCEGLPADDQVVLFFRRAYEDHSSPKLRIAAAECLGYLRSGLGQAMKLFLPLLPSHDESTTRKTAEAISRTLRVQSRLAQEAREWGEMFHVQYFETVDQLRASREALCGLAGPDNLKRVLTDTGCVSPFDLLSHAQDQEEDFLMQNRDRLLRQHRNRFVAIRERQIVAVAEDPKTLENAVREKLGSEARILMARITPETFERPSSAHIFVG